VKLGELIMILQDMQELIEAEEGADPEVHIGIQPGYPLSLNFYGVYGPKKGAIHILASDSHPDSGPYPSKRMWEEAIRHY